jgi:hypothetical protein
VVTRTKKQDRNAPRVGIGPLSISATWVSE